MLLRRLKDVSLIQVLVKTSLQLVQLVNLIQVPVVTSLGRLRFLGFVYVPLRRRKDVSNRSILLTYQLRCCVMSQHGPVRSNQSLEWVNLFWVLGSRFFRHLRQFSLFKVPASTSLQRLKDGSLIQVPTLTSLRCVKLVSLTQVLIGTSLRRLKLVGLNCVPMRRHKDVSNRSVSFTYQSRRCDDVSAWSATSRPI